MAMDTPRKPDGTRQALISFGALLEAEGLRTRLSRPGSGPGGASGGGGLALRAWDPEYAGAVVEIEHDGTGLACAGKQLTDGDCPAVELEAAAAAVARQAREPM